EAAQHWSQILSNCHVFDQPLPPEALQQAFLTKEKVLRDCFSATKTLEQKPHHHIPELFNQNYRISDFLGMLSGELSHEGKTSHIVEVCSLSQTLIESPYASQQRHNAYHHNHYRDPDTPLPILPDAPVDFDGAVAAILQLIHEQRKVFLEFLTSSEAVKVRDHLKQHLGEEKATQLFGGWDKTSHEELLGLLHISPLPGQARP
ncbi:hypothetical protein OAN22_02755, partial [Alphaproteobacteria bacterium]|nr:hypothetical protein [Alphaproteobacteria bacterium]